MLMDMKQTRLPSGVRVVTSSIPHVQSVTLGIWVGVGARHEPSAQSGISHFTEHLLFKGTKKRSCRDITVGIEGRGGYLNAFTGEEHTCYYARVSVDQAKSALNILADMYQHSRFEPAE
ncbi:MAG: insulinase family protein, partial [Verrucomicrobia bacterium]|nr:insulinase family protein [Verrucomicrobiota bacterium]